MKSGLWSWSKADSGPAGTRPPVVEACAAGPGRVSAWRGLTEAYGEVGMMGIVMERRTAAPHGWVTRPWHHPPTDRTGPGTADGTGPISRRANPPRCGGTGRVRPLRLGRPTMRSRGARALPSGGVLDASTRTRSATAIRPGPFGCGEALGLARPGPGGSGPSDRYRVQIVAVAQALALLRPGPRPPWPETGSRWRTPARWARASNCGSGA